LLLALHAASRGLDVVLATKATLQDSNTAWAQGGVAAALDLEEDSAAAHVADTVAAGAGLCDVAAAEVVAREAPQRVEELARLGVAFSLALDGGLALTREAAHSHARVAFAADRTGQAISSTLGERVRAQPNVTVIERACAIQLAADAGGCHGAWLLEDGHARASLAGATVLATGGIGRLFKRTTNPPGATGDGLALALAAGAKLADLEFVQFHPTALALANAPALLISEAARGEGAILVDELGRRFVFDADPRGELAPRDVVARAIYRCLRRDGAAVYLDLRPIGAADVIRRRFPNIAAACARFGVDIGTQPVPVAPAAHYHMGGVLTDLWGRTSLPALYAIGECACTGLHGANRLASNSLAECLVFAARAAENIADRRRVDSEHAPSPPQPEIAAPDDAGALRDLMWLGAGIERDGPALRRLCESLTGLRAARRPLEGGALEARSMWIAGQRIAEAALAREESRGSHFRTDFPDRDDSRWRVRIAWTQDGWSHVPVASAA